MCCWYLHNTLPVKARFALLTGGLAEVASFLEFQAVPTAE
jgi:hypothetical protein